MADIKFSEFPKATTSKDGDEIAILQDGVNKMIASPVLESKIINKTVSRVIEQSGASLNVVNLKGIVPTYEDLALITPTPELNDAYQVEADGLVYVYTENGFQADGEGIVVQPAPIGVVEEGNENAVSGDEVFETNQYLGNLTHNNNTGIDNVDLFFSYIDKIYIQDTEQLNNSNEYGINYVWINSASINPNVRRFGFQVMINEDLYSNYGLKFDTDDSMFLAENLVELKPQDSSEPLYNRVKIFVKFKNTIPTETVLQQSTLYPFYNNAFLKTDVENLIKDTEYKNTIITVSKETDGNNAIQLALNSITDASKNNTYEVRVKKGIYKAENSTDFTANGNYPAFILAKDNVSVVGDSSVDCLVWAELPYNDADINRPIYRILHQTVYSWADNSTFQNLTFVAKNIRYALHQDNPQETNKTRYYIDCNFKSIGNKGLFSALGIGTYSGSKTYVKGGYSSSEYLYPFACHNNQVFSDASLWDFENHTFRSVTNDCIGLQNSGSLISDILRLNNCTFDGGFIFKYMEWYIYTPNYNDSFNHANWQVLGSGNSPMCVENNVLGKGLRVDSLTNAGSVRFDVNSSAYPLIIANDKNYFGNLGHPEREIYEDYIIHDFFSSIPSYAIGCMSIQEDDYEYGTTTSQDRLGLRLGDCSTANKTLGIIINDITYNIVFDKNYTSFTNSLIIAEINAVLDGIGTASEYIVGRDYYPEFTDVNFVLRNNSSEPILKGTLVSKIGTGIKKATTGDIVFGIAIDDIEPSWKTGEGVYYGFGRIIKKMIFHTDQVLKEPGVVIEKNKKYSALAGKLIEEINGNLIGYENDYLLIQ